MPDFNMPATPPKGPRMDERWRVVALWGPGVRVLHVTHRRWRARWVAWRIRVLDGLPTEVERTGR